MKKIFIILLISLTCSFLYGQTKAVSGELQTAADYSANYTNRSIPDKEYVDDAIAAGGSSSDSSWTSITVDTATISTGDGRIVFGDGDTYLNESSDDNLSLYVDGGYNMRYAASSTTVGKDLLSGSSGVNIGSSSVFFDQIYGGKRFIDATTIWIWRSGTELTFNDPVTGTKTLAELAAGGGSSDSSWTSIIVDTVRFAPPTSYNAKIWESGGYLNFSDDGSSATLLELKRLVGGRDVSSTLVSGGSAVDGYSITWDNSENEYTLTDISGGSSADTIPIGDIVRLLVDSTLLWSWDFTDSSQFVNDRWMTRFFHAGPDTLAIQGVRAGAVGGSPNFEWNIAYNDSLSYTGDYTKGWTTDLVVTGTDATTVGEIDTSPNNPSIPPGNWVFLYLDDLTVKPTYGCSFNVYGYEY